MQARKETIDGMNRAFGIYYRMQQEVIDHPQIIFSLERARKAHESYKRKWMFEISFNPVFRIEEPVIFLPNST